MFGVAIGDSRRQAVAQLLLVGPRLPGTGRPRICSYTELAARILGRLIQTLPGLSATKRPQPSPTSPILYFSCSLTRCCFSLLDSYFRARLYKTWEILLSETDSMYSRRHSESFHRQPAYRFGQPRQTLYALGLRKFGKSSGSRLFKLAILGSVTYLLARKISNSGSRSDFLPLP